LKDRVALGIETASFYQLSLIFFQRQLIKDIVESPTRRGGERPKNYLL